MYHSVARAVNYTNYVTLHVVGIAVLDPVKIHHSLLVLRVIEEVQFVHRRSCTGRIVRMNQLHYILAVKDVLGSLGDGAVDLLDLLRPESGMVVGKLHRNGVAAFCLTHAPELPSGLPDISPSMEERNALKLEVEALNTKLAELTEEEMMRVSGYFTVETLFFHPVMMYNNIINFRWFVT